MKRLFAVVFVLVVIAPSAARAQAQSPRYASPLPPSEPDYTLIGLPTALRLPKFGSSFRVTHRFTRPLDCDACTDSLLEDFFGIDSGAVIGLEYRFGITPNGQIGIHRTSNKTIEFFAQYGLLEQGRTLPVDITAYVTAEGTNNFRDSYSPAVGVIVSRTFGDVGAAYVEPIWVNNTNTLPSALVDHNDTFMIGLGARLEIRRTVYLVGEVAPRLNSYKPGVTYGSFGIEKRAGGHLFQINFSNGFGTTLAQIARGGPAEKNWFLGFNISRKFF